MLLCVCMFFLYWWGAHSDEAVWVRVVADAAAAEAAATNWVLELSKETVVLSQLCGSGAAQRQRARRAAARRRPRPAHQSLLHEWRACAFGLSNVKSVDWSVNI